MVKLNKGRAIFESTDLWFDGTNIFLSHHYSPFVASNSTHSWPEGKKKFHVTQPIDIAHPRSPSRLSELACSKSESPKKRVIADRRCSNARSPPYRRKMGLWAILEGFLLLATALAILNEDRFLAPRGWSFSAYTGDRAKSFKGQPIGLIFATQYLRVPLVLLNANFIIVKLVSG